MINTAVVIPEAVVTLILAILVCLFGYKLKKIAFFIIWFIIGYHVGKLIPPSVFNNDQIWGFVIPIAIGILFSMIGLSVERLCVALLAGAIGFFLTIDYLGGAYTFMPNVLIAVIVAVILGCIAVAAIKPMIIFVTAVGGAYYIGLTLIPLFGLATVPFFYIITIVSAVFGLGFQFTQNKGQI